MNNFLMITNKYKDRDLIITKKIQKCLTEAGAKCVVLSDLGKEYSELPNLSDDIECLIVVGGDGTILQAATVIAHKEIPIIGVNMGCLGFLAEVETKDVEHMVTCLLKDEYDIEERMMLSGTIYHEKKRIKKSRALNDIVITRNGYSRIIECEVWVNNELVDTFCGDGVILSTPTGSTGYNLSAGGPVINPRNNVITFTPVCSHSLGARSIIFSDYDEIKIVIGRRNKTQKDEALVTFDGQTGSPLEPGDCVYIKKSKNQTLLLQLNHKSFYDILRHKMEANKN